MRKASKTGDSGCIFKSVGEEESRDVERCRAIRR